MIDRLIYNLYFNKGFEIRFTQVNPIEELYEAELMGVKASGKSIAEVLEKLSYAFS